MRTHTVTTERVGAFSDGLIAVIITIMALELKAPEKPDLAALLALWQTAASYALSYLFVAIIWVNHHHRLRLVRYAPPQLIWMNFAHLFLVSLLPFTTAWIARTDLAPVPVAAHASLFVLINVAYLVFERQILASASVEDLSASGRGRAHRRTLVGLLIFVAAAVVAPEFPYLGVGLICAALLLYLRPEGICGGAIKATGKTPRKSSERKYPNTSKPRGHLASLAMSPINEMEHQHV